MTDFRYPHRLERLQQEMQSGEHPVDAVLVTTLENARYLSGFSGSNALVLVTRGEALFVTDSRYALQSEREVTGFERVILPPGTVLMEAAGGLLPKLGVRRAGFESHALPFGNYEELRKATPAPVDLIPRPLLVEALRAVKDADEIAAIRRACAVVDDCFDHLCRVARVGMIERELAWELEVFMRRDRGASRLGFDTIVGSGPNSALIHGRAGDRVLGASGGPEFLLCDYGCVVDDYHADITRTFIIGGEPTDRQREVYEAVREAQAAALSAIRPGVEGKEVDRVARDVLAGAGLGDAFGHSLGHGLGRQGHDYPPLALSPKSAVTLRPGMVVTVEPGAYLEGFGGVRIEDDVVVTETGCEILTRSPKELLLL